MENKKPSVSLELIENEHNEKRYWTTVLNVLPFDNFYFDNYLLQQQNYSYDEVPSNFFDDFKAEAEHIAKQLKVPFEMCQEDYEDYIEISNN